MITTTIWCSARRPKCWARVTGPSTLGYDAACAATNALAVGQGWTIVRATAAGTVREAYCAEHRPA